MMFWQKLRETLTPFALDLGGLVAGLLLLYYYGVFEKATWVIALYPVIISCKLLIDGFLSGRLSTALHLGIIYPRFSKNTTSFYKLIEATVVLTLIVSAASSTVAVVFGDLFWGLQITDFATVFGIVIATMFVGLLFIPVTIQVSHITFKKALDPDLAIFPSMSAASTIFVTLAFITVTSMIFMPNLFGLSIIALLVASQFSAASYFLVKNFHEHEFIRIIGESLAALAIVAVIANITGTLLRTLSLRVNATYVNKGLEFIAVYPPLIIILSDVGSIVGSAATTKLALGLLKPKISSLKNHAKDVLSAWIGSLLVFIILAFASLFLSGVFTLTRFYSYLVILLVANVIAVILMVMFSFALSVLTFQKGLDPGNFVSPIQNAFGGTIASMAFLASIILAGLG